MKGWLARPGVQRALGGALAAYLRLAVRTTRWRVDGRERVDPLLGTGQGIIFCFWHQAIPMSALVWPTDVPNVQPMHALISRSRDGALIAEVVRRLGVPAVRGSRAEDASRTREKGGMEALRDMARCVRDGGAIAITPDGPRGPPRHMGDGPALLAKLTGAPVFVVGLSSRPAWMFKTWDRMFAPVPFGRSGVAWRGPFYLGRDDDAADATATWQRELDEATEVAWRLVA